MRDKFKDIPNALKRQLLFRFGIAALFTMVFILILVFTKDIYFALPCIIASVFFTINGGIVLYDCLMNRYVIISSQCIRIERTPVLRRIKSIELYSERGVIRVPIRNRLKRIQEGNMVILYVSSRTAVCEMGNERMICGYYAIEIE